MILPQSLRIERSGDGEGTRRNLLRRMASISMGLPLSHLKGLSLVAEAVAQSERTPTHIQPAPLPRRPICRPG